MQFLSGKLSVASAGTALLVIPLILLAERTGISQAPFHLTQLLATLVCVASSARFLWVCRGEAVGWVRAVALLGGSLSGAWLLFVAWVMLTLEFPGMD